MIITILSVALIISAIFTFANYMTYGGFIPDKDLPFVQKMLDKAFVADRYIIHCGLGHFASKEHFSLLWRWQIQGEGKVWVWSKIHKLLEKKHKELRAR